MHSSHIPMDIVPFSQLGRKLTAREEAQDGLVVEIGMRSARRLSASCRIRIAQASVLYVWPESSRHHPHPSSPTQPG